MTLTPDLLIRNVKMITDSTTGDTPVDIRIRDGVIREIGASLDSQAGEETLDVGVSWISPGLMDMHVHFRETGQEKKETIKTGAGAAAFVVYTYVTRKPISSPQHHKRKVV